MARGVVTWSQTAASNDVADTGVNWAEGQAPSSINDSARAMMASAAKWRDDIAGFVLVAGGSGTAYTITTNQVFAANNNGNTIQFTPGSTNTGAVTLACDGQTALPLRFLTGVDLPAGVLISGSLYQATLRSSEWLLHSSPLAQPFLIPIGGIIEYGGTTAPNANFILPQGQAISQATYAALFTLFGTAFNTGGEPGGTFRVPDLVGRVTAMIDAGSARLSSSFFGSTPNLGARGGSEGVNLTIANINSFTPTGTFSASLSGGSAATPLRVFTTATPTSDVTHVAAGNSTGADAGTIASPVSGSVSGSVSMGALGSGTAHNNVQPTFILNKILRAL